MKIILLTIFLLLPASVSALQIDAGSYSGTSGDDRDISININCKPDLVIIKGNNGQAPYYSTAALATTSNAYSLTMRGNARMTQDRIQALKTAAFQVGTNADVNQSGVLYAYLAVCNEDSRLFEEGTYLGNGADDRNISLATTTWSAWLHTKEGDNTETGGWRIYGLAADNSLQWHEFGGLQTNQIQNFSAGVFQLGTANHVNRSGSRYYYFSFDFSPYISVGTYTGDGVDGRVIETGFPPIFALTKESDSNYGVGYTVGISPKDTSWTTTFTAFTGADRIQGFRNNGFEVGTLDSVNGGSLIYYYVALQNPKRKFMSY